MEAKQEYRVVETTTPRLTVPQLWAAVGEHITSRWEALGQADDKIQWAYGAEADALIPEFPAMVVYKAIAIKAGKSAQTIRKAYYTFKAFDEETRRRFSDVPYSVFQHARTQRDPIAVLSYYIENRASVDEIEMQFPVVEDEEFEREFSARGYPRYLYSVYREIYLLDDFLRARAEEHMNELKSIIDGARNGI